MKTRRHRRSAAVERALGRGFTLLEMMIVVAIMAIIMTMGVPVMYKLWHKAPMIKAVRDTQEVLQNARARAILQGHMVEVIFHPQSRSFEVSGAAAVAPRVRRAETDDLGAIEPPPAAALHSGMSAQLDESIRFEMLDVNHQPDFADQEVAHVHFWPNGTCDELTVVLLSEKNERYKITLEVTTGLATVGRVDQ